MKNKKKILLIIIPILLIVISTGYIMLTKVNFTKLLGLVNPMDLKSSDVPYTNNSQSTVQGAIDNLYNKANTWVDPSTYPVKMNTAKTVWASPAGVCIKRNNKGYCFGINNYTYEKDHIRSVFSDITCNVGSDDVRCNASDFGCIVFSNGYVDCGDQSDNSFCYVNSDGTVRCY